MSTKVKLNFDKTEDPVLENKLPGKGYIIRLTSGIRFKTKEDWTDPYLGILDTGAHISVIPLKIWSKSEVNILTVHEMKGIVPKKECSVTVLVGEIKASLVDSEENHTREFTALGYFALTNRIPLIIGFKRILEEFEFCSNYQKNEAFIIG